jgi:hypothetical protein
MSSSGSIIQISAVGLQDAIIRDSPTHTLFKSVHLRFSSFALDDEISPLSTSGFGTMANLTLNRYGDLISRIALEITLPPLAAPQISTVPATNPATYVDADLTGAHYVNCIGFAIFDTCDLVIGGTTIDSVTSDYAFVFEELSGRPGLRLEELIGRVQYSSEVDEDLMTIASKQQILYVPIPFFLSKYQPETYGQSLPIIALSFHDVRINLVTRSIAECTWVVYKKAGVWTLCDSSVTPLNALTGAPLANADLTVRVMVSYVYLDTVERNAITSAASSYLINTSQKNTFAVAANSATLAQTPIYLNHPSTDIIWFARPNDWFTGAGRRRYSCGHKDRFDFTSQVPSSVTSLLPYGDVTETVVNASLSLNGHQRFPSNQPGVYFRVSQPYTNFRTMPATAIYAYAFGTQPSKWQPDSTLNFSRLDHVSLGLNYAVGVKASELVVLNEAYNLLVVDKGMAGLTNCLVQCYMYIALFFFSPEQQAVGPRGSFGIMN